MNKSAIEALALEYAGKASRKTHPEIEYNYHLYNGTMYSSNGFPQIPHEQVEGDCSILNYSPHRRLPFGTTVLQRLASEMNMHKHQFKATVINSNATSKFEEQRNEFIQKRFRRIVEDIALSENEDEMEAKVKKLQRDIGISYQSNTERAVNEILSMLTVDDSFANAMTSGIGHRIAAGVEAYYWITNLSVPILVSVDPRDITVYGSGNTYEHSDAVCVMERLNVSEVLKRYGSLLSNNQKRELISRRSTECDDLVRKPMALIFPHETSMHTDAYIEVKTVFMRVNKSMKMIDTIKDAVKYTHIMDSSYSPNDGEKSKTIVVPQAVRVVFIDGTPNAVYVAPEPIQNTFAHAYDAVPLGIYGDRGAAAWPNDPCVASMIAPSQKELDMIYGKFVDMLHRNIGKILQIDLSSIPQGWSIERYVDMIKNNGLSVVDSASAQALAASTVNARETHVIDLELASTISNLMGAMAKLEQDIVTLSGVSKERMGIVNPYQSASSVNTSIRQSEGGSSCIAKHNKLAERVITVGVEIVRRGVAGRSCAHTYMLSQATLDLIKNDNDDVNLVNYGIIIDDNQEVSLKMQMIQQEAAVAFRNGSMSFGDFLSCLEAKSIDECIMLIQDAKDKEAHMQQRMMQQEQQMMSDMQGQSDESQKAQIRKQPDSYERVMLEKRKLDDSMEKFNKRHALNEKRFELAEKKFNLENNVK